MTTDAMERLARHRRFWPPKQSDSIAIVVISVAVAPVAVMLVAVAPRFLVSAFQFVLIVPDLSIQPFQPGLLEPHGRPITPATGFVVGPQGLLPLLVVALQLGSLALDLIRVVVMMMVVPVAVPAIPVVVSVAVGVSRRRHQQGAEQERDTESFRGHGASSPEPDLLSRWAMPFVGIAVSRGFLRPAY